AAIPPDLNQASAVNGGEDDISAEFEDGQIHVVQDQEHNAALISEDRTHFDLNMSAEAAIPPDLNQASAVNGGEDDISAEFEDGQIHVVQDQEDNAALISEDRTHFDLNMSA
ncbi:hypothetical protein ACJX0J_033180, partial [Zea mays]